MCFRGSGNRKRWRQLTFRKNEGSIVDVSFLSELKGSFSDWKRETLTGGVFWVLELHLYLWGLDLSMQEGSVVLVEQLVASGLRGREPVMGLALEAKKRPCRRIMNGNSL